MLVTASQLRAKASELKNLNEQFLKEVNELEGTEQTLSGMWEGDANTAFHTAFTSDKVQMHNFYNAIEVYVARLIAAAERYEAAEAQNRETATTRTYH